MASSSSHRPAGARTVALWAVLAASFSPVLVDLAHHLAESPWADYAVLFPLLFARCALREPKPREEQADGVAWIAVGLLLELAGIFLGSLRIGRPGLALAAIGLCRRFALASGRSQLLLLFAVPIPTLLVRIGSPHLPAGLLELGAGVAGALGFPVETSGLVAHTGSAELELVREDGGIALAPLLAGLAWYDSIVVGLPPGRALLRVVLAALCAVPLQAVAVTLAVLGLVLGEPVLARRLLTHLPWIATALLLLCRTELRRRRMSGG